MHVSSFSLLIYDLSDLSPLAVSLMPKTYLILCCFFYSRQNKICCHPPCCIYFPLLDRTGNVSRYWFGVHDSGCNKTSCDWQVPFRLVWAVDRQPRTIVNNQAGGPKWRPENGKNHLTTLPQKNSDLCQC